MVPNPNLRNLDEATAQYIDRHRRNRDANREMRRIIEALLVISHANGNILGLRRLQAMLDHVIPLHAGIDPERLTYQAPLAPFANAAIDTAPPSTISSASSASASASSDTITDSSAA